MGRCRVKHQAARVADKRAAALCASNNSNSKRSGGACTGPGMPARPPTHPPTSAHHRSKGQGHFLQRQPAGAKSSQWSEKADRGMAAVGRGRGRGGGREALAGPAANAGGAAAAPRQHHPRGSPPLFTPIASSGTYSTTKSSRPLNTSPPSIRAMSSREPSRLAE
jgi:hypothetical protein